MRRSILADRPEFRIIRKQSRKRIALRIADDGVLEILAPENVPEAFLLQIPEKESGVIARLRSRSAEIRRPQAEFTEGAEFALLGKFYPLHLSSRLKIFDGERFIIPRGNAEDIREELIGLYREIAGRYLLKRAAVLESLTGLHAEQYRISSADRRWGSCNSKRGIALSWKLIQCPPDTIDYVIIHELAHLKELNHSAKFWKIVGTFSPHYPELRRKLNEFSRSLPQL